MQFHVYKYTLFTLLLLYLTYEDIKYKEINLLLTIAFIIFCLVNGQNYNTFFFISIIMGLVYLLNKNKIGEGDIIIISILSLFIKFEYIGYFFVLIGCTTLIFMKYNNIKIIPLIPFITISFLLTKIIEIYL